MGVGVVVGFEYVQVWVSGACGGVGICVVGYQFGCGSACGWVFSGWTIMGMAGAVGVAVDVDVGLILAAVLGLAVSRRGSDCSCACMCGSWSVSWCGSVFSVCVFGLGVGDVAGAVGWAFFGPVFPFFFSFKERRPPTAVGCLSSAVQLCAAQPEPFLKYVVAVGGCGCSDWRVTRVALPRPPPQPPRRVINCALLMLRNGSGGPARKRRRRRIRRKSGRRRRRSACCCSSNRRRRPRGRRSSNWSSS